MDDHITTGRVIMRDRGQEKISKLLIHFACVIMISYNPFVTDQYHNKAISESKTNALRGV